MKDWKNTLKRAIRTFVQAALGYAAAHATGLIGDGEGVTRNALAALAVASVAAGIAALMNLPESAPDIEVYYGANEAVRKYVEDVSESDIITAELAADGREANTDGGADGE